MTVTSSNPTPKAGITPNPGPARKPATRSGSWELPVILFFVAIVLGWAWARRGEGDISAEVGLGYALGIIGGLMMLVLLVYPLRKRLRALRFLGKIPVWFRLHMVLGVAGPTLILLHSNFSFGSLNSTAAMLPMLVVAGSGFIGRFLYSRIHRGLYGQKQTVRELIAEVEEIRARLSGDVAQGAAIADELTRYQAARLGGINGFLASLKRTLTGPMSRSRLRAGLIRDFKRPAAGGSVSAPDLRLFAEALDRYLYSLGRAEAFTLYERMFAAWHLLHLPLFAILVLASVAHIIAVHLY